MSRPQHVRAGRQGLRGRRRPSELCTRGPRMPLLRGFAEYGWKLHWVTGIIMREQTKLSRASSYCYMREQERGTISVNSRFQTVLLQQPTCQCRRPSAPALHTPRRHAHDALRRLNKMQNKQQEANTRHTKHNKHKQTQRRLCVACVARAAGRGGDADAADAASGCGEPRSTSGGTTCLTLLV